MFSGNDLVCIDDINTATFSRKGAAKVMLSPDEGLKYLESGAFILMKLWAVKEAAYKYFCKNGNRVPFQPAAICVSFNNDGKSGEVRQGNSVCRFILTLTDSYIHAICSSEPEQYRVAIGKTEEPLLYSLTGSAVSEVRSDSDGVPLLFVNGKPVADISKSSDGCYLAYTMRKENG